MARVNIKLKRPITDFELDIDENSINFKWIPCSERLPERPERVQIQMKNSWIITGYYDGEAWYSVPDDGVSMDDEYVKAWMPLPAPYSEEGDPE